MPTNEPTLTLHLPCVKYSIPCPYADRTGKEASWTCCGVRPAVKMAELKECPKPDVARAEYKKKAPGPTQGQK